MRSPRAGLERNPQIHPFCGHLTWKRGCNCTRHCSRWRGPILHGRVGGWEFQRSDLNAQLEALVLGEEVSEVFLDGRASIEHAPGKIDIIAVRRPERRHRFGVALLESF